MKVKPSSIRIVSDAVNTAEQGVRKTGQTLKTGMTSTVIGAQVDEQPNQSNQRNSRRRRSLIPDKAIQSVERKYSNYQWHSKKVTEQCMQEKEFANLQRFKHSDRSRTLPNKSRSSVFPQKGYGAKAATETAVKGMNTATKVTKGTVGVGVKGATFSTGVATGAATAGTSTAATVAVTGAVRAAKRIASMTQEALASSAVQNKSSNQISNSLPSEKNKRGSSGKLGIFAAFVATLLLPVLPLLMIIAVLVPLSSLQSNDNGGTINSNSIVMVAEQELNVSDDNVGGGKYKNWYGLDDNWCAMFVSWCANQCGYVDSGIMPRTASVAYMKSWYEQHDQYHIKESGYEPRAGDVVIFLRGKSHTGLVVDFDSNTKVLTTIEGNTGTSSANPYHEGSHVRQKQYPLTYEAIDGYCSPCYPIT